jgi:hypothetical protein
MTLEQIEQAIEAELNGLEVMSKRPDLHIVDFDRYKPLYDMLIALRQAQALERIANQIDGFRISGFPVENLYK